MNELACKSCDWVGDHGDYQLVDDGKLSKTAVCPECRGQMRLNHD
jgi:rubredoxin